MFCQPLVRCGRKCYTTAEGFLVPDKFNHFRSIRQIGRVQINPGSKLALYEGFTRKQPERDQQQSQGTSLKEHENALPKYVAANQSAIKVDAQYWRRLCRSNAGDSPHRTMVA